MYMSHEAFELANSVFEQSEQPIRALNSSAAAIGDPLFVGCKKFLEFRLSPTVMMTGTYVDDA
jgi:hypothetical protein